MTSNTHQASKERLNMKDIQRMQSRIPKHLHKWLKARGKKANRSMNGELVNLLATMKAKDLEKQLEKTT